MNYEEMKQYIIENIKSYLPSEYADAEVSYQSVKKVNEETREGIAIFKNDQKAAPTIYFDNFFDQSVIKSSNIDKSIVDETIKRMADFHLEWEVSGDYDISNKIESAIRENRILCQLVNAEKNKDFLASAPHKLLPNNDLAAIFSIEVSSPGNPSEIGMIKIDNSIASEYGLTSDMLFAITKENISKETCIENLAAVMRKQLIEIVGLSEEAAMQESPDMPVWILSNTKGFLGANQILADSAMDAIAEKIGAKYLYINPSSIHEMLVMDANVFPLDFVKEALLSVNETEVSDREWLSDNVYEYNVETHELYIAGENKEQQRGSLSDKLFATEKMVESQNCGSREPSHYEERG